MGKVGCDIWEKWVTFLEMSKPTSSRTSLREILEEVGKKEKKKKESTHLLGDIEADLLKDLPRRTAHLVLVAVHLPLREPPALRLPPLDAQHLGTRLVDEHRASK